MRFEQRDLQYMRFTEPIYFQFYDIYKKPFPGTILLSLLFKMTLRAQLILIAELHSLSYSRVESPSVPEQWQLINLSFYNRNKITDYFTIVIVSQAPYVFLISHAKYNHSSWVAESFFLRGQWSLTTLTWNWDPFRTIRILLFHQETHQVYVSKLKFISQKLHRTDHSDNFEHFSMQIEY